MSSKRKSGATAEQANGQKRGKPTIAADTVDVNAVMTSEGPIVTAVVLRANGEYEELILDMSPKLQLVAKELGGSVGFLGQWESLEVVLIMRADQDDSSFDVNKHKLQPPFDEAEVRGDILLMRNDEEGIPANFTLAEYNAFQKLDIPKWEPGDQDAGDEDDEVSEDEEEDDEEMDDGSENESDDEEVESFFDYMLEEELAKFRAANSREPSAVELREIDERVRSIAKDADIREGENEEEGDEEEDADDDVAEQLNLFLEKIYGRLLTKFKLDNGADPTEEEITTLREQAAEISDQIIAQQQALSDEGEGEDGDEEDEEGDDDEEVAEGEDQEDDEDEEENGDEEEGAVPVK